MKVILINNQNDVELNLDFLEKVSSYISDKFDRDPGCELNIVFTGKKEIRELNQKYRGIDRETDVLSFSYNKDKDIFGFGNSVEIFKDEHGFYTIGEIIICPQVARENVTKYVEEEVSSGWGLDLEIILLIIHGILHIYGYDHEREEDRIKMDGIQKSILHDVRSTFGL